MNMGAVDTHTMKADSLDSCLTLVADRRRRRLLNHLRHNGNGEASIDDLIDLLYQAETNHADGLQMSRDNLAIQLHHTHLPMLTDHGVVEHDHERGTITYRPDEPIMTVLDGLPEEPALANP